MPVEMRIPLLTNHSVGNDAYHRERFEFLVIWRIGDECVRIFFGIAEKLKIFLVESEAELVSLWGVVMGRW